MAAITAGKVAPGLVDRYLAQTGVEAQQTSESLDVHRPSYLWEPVAGDHGAHGRFDGEARGRSLHLLWRKHRRSVALGAATASALVLGKRLG